MAAKIKDVARLAGVSTATVSRVLSNEGYVSEEARKSVLAAMERLHYQPSRVARSLRVRRSSIIGLLISDIQNPFFISLARAVEDIARQHLHAIFLCNADENGEKEQFYLDLMQAEHVAGVIVSPTQERADPCLQLLQAGIPFVVVDRKLADADVDTVVVDNAQSAYQLVKHLIADGHRRIGAILGLTVATTGRERYEGYAQALTEHQLPLSPTLVRTGVPREEDGYQLTNELLDLAEPPGAIFVGNNLLTVGVFRAISERGLRIPEDIALASFDEMGWMSLVKPALTVIKQPTYDIGRIATELLFQRIADPLRPVQQIVVHSTLNIRQSCGLHQHGMPVSQTVRAAHKEREIV